MKNIIRLLGLLIALSSISAAQETPPKIFGKYKNKDVAAIQKVITEAMNEGWEKYDVEKAVAEYTDDAYFINAFGVQKYGRDEIKIFVMRIFGQENFRKRVLEPLKFVSIRFIRPDIASVHTFQQTNGQLKPNGTPEGLRKTHVFRIMLKRGGRWMTDSFQVTDERL